MYTPDQQYAIMLNLHRPEVEAELDQRIEQRAEAKKLFAPPVLLREPEEWELP